MLGGWFAKGTPEEGSPLYLPELETPNTRQQYEDLAGRTLEVLLRLEREDEDYGWFPIDVADEDVELWEKPDKTGFSCIKTGGVIPVNAKSFFDWICPQTIEERQRWDSDLNEYRVIEEISDNIDVIYRSYNTPAYGVAPREFVALNAKCKLPDGAYISYGKSINHKDGKYISKYVRGNALVSGLIVRPIEGERNKCYVWRIAQLDPRGMIPGWVISLGKKRAASGFAKLREIASKEIKPISIQEEEEQQQRQVQLEEEEEQQVVEQVVEVIEERNREVTSGHSIIFEQQTSAILTNIQMMISNVQLELRSYHSSLKETKESLQNSFGNQLAFLQNQVLHHQNRRIHLNNLGWDTILFIIAWPFVFQLLWNYFTKKLLKK